MSKAHVNSSNKNKSVIVTMTIAGVIFIVVVIATLSFSKKFYSDMLYQTIRDDRANFTELFQKPSIASVLIKGNLEHKNYSAEQIEAEDLAWRQASDNSQMINQILKSSASDELRLFQVAHPAYIELFITDRYGLNVAMTNKTSDYYQADEGWWQHASKLKEGDPPYLGEIEFDESANAWSIAKSSPIFDKNGKFIGVSKAVFDLKAIHNI